MQHDFRKRDQSEYCIGSEFLTREDISISEGSLVLQAGRSHRFSRTFVTSHLQHSGKRCGRLLISGGRKVVCIDQQASYWLCWRQLCI